MPLPEVNVTLQRVARARFPREVDAREADLRRRRRDACEGLHFGKAQTARRRDRERCRDSTSPERVSSWAATGTDITRFFIPRSQVFIAGLLAVFFLWRCA